MKTYTSQRRLERSRLMRISRASGHALFVEVGDLQSALGPHDLLVMNASATIPASFQIRPDLEIRLAAFAGRTREDLREWWAISFGEGCWRIPTEERGPAPRVEAGQWLTPYLRVLSADGRLLRVRFEGDDYLQQIYRHGRPIQYAYHRDALALWDVQTPLAGIPLSVEPPSALMPFSWRQLLSLRAQTAYLLHGAGLSSTGDVELDGVLPLPEYFEIPQETAALVQEAKARGGRVIAVGTTVARALESSARLGVLQGQTELRLGPREEVRVVDGLLTGFHEPETSHFSLEEALVPRRQLERAFGEALARGFLGHEFGDAVLIA